MAQSRRSRSRWTRRAKRIAARYSQRPHRGTQPQKGKGTLRLAKAEARLRSPDNPSAGASSNGFGQAHHREPKPENRRLRRFRRFRIGGRRSRHSSGFERPVFETLGGSSLTANGFGQAHHREQKPEKHRLRRFRIGERHIRKVYRFRATST